MNDRVRKPENIQNNQTPLNFKNQLTVSYNDKAQQLQKFTAKIDRDLNQLKLKFDRIVQSHKIDKSHKKARKQSVKDFNRAIKSAVQENTHKKYKKSLTLAAKTIHQMTKPLMPSVQQKLVKQIASKALKGFKFNKPTLVQPSSAINLPNEQALNDKFQAAARQTNLLLTYGDFGKKQNQWVIHDYVWDIQHLTRVKLKDKLAQKDLNSKTFQALERLIKNQYRQVTQYVKNNQVLLKRHHNENLVNHLKTVGLVLLNDAVMDIFYAKLGAIRQTMKRITQLSDNGQRKPALRTIAQANAKLQSLKLELKHYPTSHRQSQWNDWIDLEKQLKTQKQQLKHRSIQKTNNRSSQSHMVSDLDSQAKNQSIAREDNHYVSSVNTVQIKNDNGYIRRHEIEKPVKDNNYVTSVDYQPIKNDNGYVKASKIEALIQARKALSKYDDSKNSQKTLTPKPSPTKEMGN